MKQCLTLPGGGGGGGGGNISVSVLPQDPSVTLSGTVQFHATVTGSSNQSVIWSVTCTGNLASCGTINSVGLFTAPSTDPYSGGKRSGNMMVVAKSVADTTKSDFSYVVVTVPGDRYNCVLQSCEVASGGAYSSYGSCQSACGGTGGGPPNSIVVNSINSVTKQPVISSWIFSSYPDQNPCTLSSCGPKTGVTYNMSQSFSDGIYTIALVGASDPSGQYSFNSNSYSPANSLTLQPGKSIGFNLLLNPVAVMDIIPPNGTNPPYIPLSDVTVSSSIVTVKNTGAPGSVLAWNTAISYAGGQQGGWLTVSPGSGNNLAAQNSAITTLTANSAGMATGTYVGYVQYTGISFPGVTSTQSKWVIVQFQVKNSGGSGGGGGGGGGGSSPPTCTYSANPSSVIPPQPSTLAWSCQNANNCLINGSSVNSTGGTQMVYPIKGSNTYTLTCTNNYGQYSDTIPVGISSTGIIETTP